MTSWIRFSRNDRSARLGRLEGGRVIEHEGDLFGHPVATGHEHALDQVRLASPCQPTKVVALWNNYHALAEKLGKRAPAHPLFLIKPATSVIGTLEAIRRPRSYAGKIVFEGELGIVIGRVCKDASEDEARAAIFGYTCVNDVTAGELIAESPDFAQWTRSKGFDTFSCIGPAIVTGFDWSRGRVVTTVDGTERQNYPLSDMIISPERQVSLLSGDMTLYPGDVIACGTSIGVGSIKDGATVSVTIEGIGELRNTLLS